MVACMMVEISGYKWPSMGDQNKTEATEAGLEEAGAVHVLVTGVVVVEGVVALDPDLVLGPDLEVTGHAATGLLVVVVAVGHPKIDLLVVKDQGAEVVTTKNPDQNPGVEAVTAEAIR